MGETYEALSQLAVSGGELTFFQSFFVKFYQAFIYNDRWMRYIEGVGTTLLVTALALILGILLGSIVALVRTAHDQQPGKRREAVIEKILEAVRRNRCAQRIGTIQSCKLLT